MSPMNRADYPPDWEEIRAVVLTVAHLDRDPSGDDPARLRAMCQRCHLRYDRAQHAASAARTRAARDGQADLFKEAP